MKTVIKTTNAKKIEQGFNNPFGMKFSNNAEVREAIANHAKSIIDRLHEQRKLNK